MSRMGQVVDLSEWRRLRSAGAERSPVSAGLPSTGAGGPLQTRRRPSGSAPSVGSPTPGPGGDLERLESAIERLHQFVSRALDGESKVEPDVETQLLAIMGELTMGLIGEATGRAERLTKRLAARYGKR